jgi:peptide chain release factor 1
MNEQLTKKIVSTRAELKQVAAELSSVDFSKSGALAKKYSQLQSVVALADKLENNLSAIDDLQSAILKNEDAEFVDLAKNEIEEINKQNLLLENQLKDELMPSNPLDVKNVILEIRAGTGGDESTLFAADLLRMYSRFAERNNFVVKIIDAARSEAGGYKEVIAEIIGQKVYKLFKFESGVHRVQRVPETEKAGRVHTSAATVAVLPEAEEIDVEIKPSDLRVDTFCASGNGGQSVNTTYSAVRVTHLPTGLVVSCQDEKSQQQNRARAMQVLRSRLLAKIQEEQATARAEQRKLQVGSGDRSEKIRTYNFPQDRVTDHRIKLTLHSINNIMDGDLHELVDALQQATNDEQI